MKTTIKEISEQYNCTPEHITDLLEWFLEQPLVLSNYIRKFTLLSLTGSHDGIQPESIILSYETLKQISDLEGTADLLQIIGEHKLNNKSNIT